MPEVFSSLGATELSGEAAKASREALLALTDAPCRWQARRPLASRVNKGTLFCKNIVFLFQAEYSYFEKILDRKYSCEYS